MKKQILAVTAVIILVAVLCFKSGNYYLFKSSDNKILSLEVPPYSDEIVLHEGETDYERFFEVIYENGFSVNDISFVSEDESIADVKYSVTDRNRYVCYKVVAKNAGDTDIYFTANDGDTVSAKIKVTVLSGAPETSNNLTTEGIYTDDLAEVSAEVSQTSASGQGQDEPSESYTDTAQPPVAASETTDVSATEQPSSETKGDMVYVSPSGIRYHYSKSCAGKNAYSVTKASAIQNGKTPCKKCAGG